MRSEEFEKWFATQYVGLSELDVAFMWDGKEYTTDQKHAVEFAWRAWNASRKAILKESIKELKS
jgi:hypothetical protein